MLKEPPSLTRPIPARQDAPFHEQGRSERKAKAYFVPYVEALSEARTPLEGFCNMLRLWYVSPWVSRPFYC